MKILRKLLEVIIWPVTFTAGTAMLSSIIALALSLIFGSAIYQLVKAFFMISPETYERTILAVVALFLYRFFYFGGFSRIKIKALSRKSRLIWNTTFNTLSVYPKNNLTQKEISDLYVSLVKFPWNNTRLALLETALLSIFLVITEYETGQSQNTLLFITAAVSITGIIYSGFIYIFSEALSGNLRTRTQEKIFEKKIPWPVKKNINGWLRPLLVVLLFASASITTYLLSYYQRDQGLYILIFITLAASVIGFIFLSGYYNFRKTMKEVVHAVEALAAGKKPDIVSSTTDTNVLNVSKALHDGSQQLENRFSHIRETLATTFQDQINHMLLEDRFSKYIPGAVRELIPGNPPQILPSVEVEMTIICISIHKFNRLTSHFNASILSTLLKEYQTEMTDIALKFNAVTDKFFNGIQFFYFPSDMQKSEEKTEQETTVDAALHMAADMTKNASAMSARWLQQNTDFPLKLKSGIHRGLTALGDFGSEQRIDYTILGPHLQTAAKFASKAAPETMLVSEDALNQSQLNYETEIVGKYKPAYGNEQKIFKIPINSQQQ